MLLYSNVILVDCLLQMHVQHNFILIVLLLLLLLLSEIQLSNLLTTKIRTVSFHYNKQKQHLAMYYITHKE